MIDPNFSAPAAGSASRRHERVRKISATASILALLAVAQSVGLSTTTWAADAAVKIDNFTFNPKVLTVTVGTTVKWTNDDDIPHIVVDNTRKVFRSKALDTEDTFSFTFSSPGTYEYFCALHPHMTARVVVTP